MASAQGSISAGSLTQGDLLRLLVTQIQNQNPLDPIKDSDFTAQFSQFSMLNNLQALNTNFDQTLRLQQLTGGSNLIGKKVQYSTDGATTLTGVVTGVQVQDGFVNLQVGSATFPLEAVLGVLPN